MRGAWGSILAWVAAAAVLSGCAGPARHRSGLFDGWEPAYRSTTLRTHHVRESENWLASMRAPSRSSSRAPAAQAVSPSPSPTQIRNVALRWPLRQVQITSAYGQRGREFHEGVDLRARPGTPVYAAHAGQVLYASDHIRGYGKMIVIRHSSGLATIYAHNSRLIVRRGQWVSQGTLIGYTGNTGHSHGPHLHFEVRSGVTTVDPLSLLPSPRIVAKRRSSRRRYVASQ